MRLGANAYAGNIYSQIPVGHSVTADGFLVRDADQAVVGTPVKNPDGSIAHWLDADGNRIAGAGFGGYDPNAPPPGYDPICWRATSWDRNHGLSCRVQANGDTVLENIPLREWLPWTADLGQTPPPSNSAWQYLRSLGEVLPHPGVLSMTQSIALYQSVRPRAADMTDDEFLAEVARVKAGVIPEIGAVLEPVDYVPPPETVFEAGDLEPIIGPDEMLLPGGEVVPVDYVPPPPIPTTSLPPEVEEVAPIPPGTVPFLPVDEEEEPVYTGPVLPPPGLAPPAPTTILPEEETLGTAPEAPRTSMLLYAAAAALGLVMLLGGPKKRG